MRHTGTKFALCLMGAAALCSLHGETVGAIGGRSLRPRALPQKAGSPRQAGVVADVDHVFPYVLSSSAWTTTFYLTNLEDRPISVQCEFVNPNGEDLPMKFDFSKPDETSVFTTSTIGAFSTASFNTVSTATTLTTGWAYCSAEQEADRVSGYAVVRNTTANGVSREFVTSLHPREEPVFSIPFTSAAAGTTALILVNSALEEDAGLGVWMFADGKAPSAGTITLKPGNLRIIVLNDAFKDVPSGTVRVVSAEGTKRVTGVALRTNTAGYTIFTPLSPK